MTGRRDRDQPTDDWRNEAACLNHSAVFLPRKDNDADTATAKRICAICPVKEACLENAMAYESGDEWRRAAVQGGLTPKERANLQNWRRDKARRHERAGT